MLAEGTAPMPVPRTQPAATSSETSRGCSYLTVADGYITSETCLGNTATYEGDARNRLTKVIRAGTTYDLQYDPAGRLARIDVGGTPTKYVLWDGDDVLAELNASGAIVQPLRTVVFSVYEMSDLMLFSETHGEVRPGLVAWDHPSIGPSVSVGTTSRN